MKEPVTWWDIKLQPKAYPTHCHRHLLSWNVTNTTKNCKLSVISHYGHSKRNRFIHKVFSKMRKSPGRNKRKPRGPWVWSQGHTWPLPCQMDITSKLFSASPRQLRRSSSGVDSFPWRETPVRYTWKDHWMPSANEHFLTSVFALNLGQRLCFHTDNLSRTLQQTKMSADEKLVLDKTFCRRCETIWASDHFMM